MEILKEQKGKCTEVLFFITEDLRFEYISVQGRVLLIYCYFLTMIVSSFSYFCYLEKGFFVTSVSFFFLLCCCCDLNWWQRWEIGFGWYQRIKCPGDFTHSKLSSHWRNKKCTRLLWGCAFLPFSSCVQLRLFALVCTVILWNYRALGQLVSYMINDFHVLSAVKLEHGQRKHLWQGSTY